MGYSLPGREEIVGSRNVAARPEYFVDVKETSCSRVDTPYSHADEAPGGVRDLPVPRTGG